MTPCLMRDWSSSGHIAVRDSGAALGVVHEREPFLEAMKNNGKKLSIFLIGALLLIACICGYHKGAVASEPTPLTFSRALYFNGDSLRYYAQKAYLEEDPHALFVTGAAAYMSRYADLPDTLPTVSLDEGAIMLLRAAELGERDAVTLIHCLDAENAWGYSIPE